jgi:predicted nucleotide-binding protein
MASKRNSSNSPEVVQPPQIGPDKGIVLVKRQIEAGEKIFAGNLIDEAEYRAWENATKNYLQKAFGLNHPNADRFKEIGRIWSAPFDAGPAYWDGVFRGFLRDQLVCLRSYIGELETELEFSQPASEANQSVAVSKSLISRKVFIVHGHNDAIRESCARFLERLDLQPIILHEQPNAGRTIIEKFQDYADVGFAVVLLTADDKGGTKHIDSAALKHRARQNVIFELGFFIGKLGGSKVCALYEDGVELPSDYNGVLFTPIDAAGTWKFQLCREIKAAGIDVDLNKAI